MNSYEAFGINMGSLGILRNPKASAGILSNTYEFIRILNPQESLGIIRNSKGFLTSPKDS